MTTIPESPKHRLLPWPRKACANSAKVLNISAGKCSAQIAPGKALRLVQHEQVPQSVTLVYQIVASTCQLAESPKFIRLLVGQSPSLCPQAASARSSRLAALYKNELPIGIAPYADNRLDPRAHLHIR